MSAAKVIGGSTVEMIIELLCRIAMLFDLHKAAASSDLKTAIPDEPSSRISSEGPAGEPATKA